MSEQTIYGLHAVLALLKNQNRHINALYVAEERADRRLHEIIDIAEERKINIVRLSTQKMTQSFPDMVHQGAVARAAFLQEYGERDLEKLLNTKAGSYLILILDGVTDPHNLGACLRSADAAGVDFVIIPKDNNASISPVVSKVACGAAEAIPLIRVTNLARMIEILKAKGIWIYGAAGEANGSLYDIDCTGSIAIVMGAEEKGLRRLTRELCDGLFSLPMAGTVSSLNVSVATGVALYEVVRQRFQADKN